MTHTLRIKIIITEEELKSKLKTLEIKKTSGNTDKPRKIIWINT